MKHTTEQHMVKCNCRSVGECTHNLFAWSSALDALVDDFAQAMKKKLRRKFMQGREGWDDPRWAKESIVERIREQIDKAQVTGYDDLGQRVHKPIDPVDVANFCAFLWNREDEG